MRKLLLPALLLIGSASCGDDVGPLGQTVGGPCVNHQDCAPGSVCLTDGDFPGGMCSIYCGSNNDCPAGAMCIDMKSGICLSSCTTYQDCRGGYECKGKKREDKLGEALVCLKD
jgi:hypothetical protein